MAILSKNYYLEANKADKLFVAFYFPIYIYSNLAVNIQNYLYGMNPVAYGSILAQALLTLSRTSFVIGASYYLLT